MSSNPFHSLRRLYQGGLSSAGQSRSRAVLVSRDGPKLQSGSVIDEVAENFCNLIGRQQMEAVVPAVVAEAIKTKNFFRLKSNS